MNIDKALSDQVANTRAIENLLHHRLFYAGLIDGLKIGLQRLEHPAALTKPKTYAAIHTEYVS